ncbi:MAG: hypothetical protein K2V38_02450 [Gemmataceae bacterium]|nr:hypothetical protein [Gemmataceae bacterium]
MEQERAKRIIDALASKKVDLPCPRCGYTEFDVIAEPDLVVREGGLFSASERLATALIACRRCGFLSCHALKVLLEPVEESVAAP